MGQSFDLRKKQQLNKIVSNITDPAVLLTKVINAVKFQELHSAKYVQGLERQLVTLQKENRNLREENL